MLSTFNVDYFLFISSLQLFYKAAATLLTLANLAIKVVFARISFIVFFIVAHNYIIYNSLMLQR